MNPPILASAGLLACLAHASYAQTDPPPASDAQVEVGTAATNEPVAEIPKTRPPIGWLSDPDTPPEDIFEALVGGKIHLDDRLRFEYADTTGSKPSYAITNRLRLGYETKAFHGFSALAEFENVATPDSDLYSVPPAGQGDPARTTVADPRGTEVNRAYLRFQTDSIGDSLVSLDVKGGRQRIILDDQRFVGNVGWRQFEQTFDSVRVQSDLGIKNLNAQYAYVWQVLRVFGPDGPDWDSQSHLINVSYGAIPELKITPFVYLLDFEESSPTNSVNNYGVRLTGDLWRDPDTEQDTFADYELSYARQTDAGSNPIDFEVDFFAAQARVTREGLGSATVGYQFLGSDDGMVGFRFPLGTNHKFQGFADQFLTTPATGLQDLYITGGVEVPFGIKSAVTLHQFWSDQGGTDLGYEVDFVASKKITPNWSVLVKAAFFDGHNGQPDTARVWVQTTLHF